MVPLLLARDFSLRSKSLTPKSVTIPHHLFFVLTRNRSAESAPPGALTRNRSAESAHPCALCQFLIGATLRLAPPKSAPTSPKCKNTEILLTAPQNNQPTPKNILADPRRNYEKSQSRHPTRPSTNFFVGGINKQTYDTYQKCQFMEVL